MELSEEIKSVIEELASYIITSYGIAIPVGNIDSIVEKLGGKVTEWADLSEYFSGAVRKVDNNSFEIILPEDLPLSRRNFLVAYELGHLFLHMGYKMDPLLWNNQTNDCPKIKNSSEEWEAKAFAAALLMPKADYETVLEKHTTGNVVETMKLAEEFHVSTSLASARGRNLGLLQ